MAIQLKSGGGGNKKSFNQNQGTFGGGELEETPEMREHRLKREREAAAAKEALAKQQEEMRQRALAFEQRDAARKQREQQKKEEEEIRNNPELAAEHARKLEEARKEEEKRARFRAEEEAKIEAERRVQEKNMDQTEALIAAIRAQVEKEKAAKAEANAKQETSKTTTSSSSGDKQKPSFRTISPEEMAELEEKKRLKREGIKPVEKADNPEPAKSSIGASEGVSGGLGGLGAGPTLSNPNGNGPTLSDPNKGKDSLTGSSLGGGGLGIDITASAEPSSKVEESTVTLDAQEINAAVAKSQESQTQKDSSYTAVHKPVPEPVQVIGGASTIIVDDGNAGWSSSDDSKSSQSDVTWVDSGTQPQAVKVEKPQKKDSLVDENGDLISVVPVRQRPGSSSDVQSAYNIDFDDDDDDVMSFGSSAAPNNNAAAEAARRAEEEEQAKAEEARKKYEEEKRAEAEKKRKAAEDAMRKAEEEQRRIREAEIKARELEESRRKAEEEEARRKAEEEARRKAEEEEARRKAEEEEARRKAEEEARRKAEEEEARRKAEEEEARRKAEEEEARRKAEEEEARRKAEEEARRKAEEEEARRKAEEEEARRKAEEEEARRKAEEEARRKAEEEEARRKAEEEEARRKAEEEEARRKAEEEARRKAEEEEARRKAEEEARRKAEEEEARRKAEEEARRKAEEEARRKAEEEEARRKAEEEARRKAEEEEARRKAEEEAQRKAEEEALKYKKMAEEAAKKAEEARLALEAVKKHGSEQKSDSPDSENISTKAPTETKSGEAYTIPVGAEQFLGKYLTVSSISEQITSTIKYISENPTQPRNVVILGQYGFGTTTIAEDFARSFHAMGICKTKTIAKIKGGALNRANISDAIGKLQGGCLVIENAGVISPEKLDEIYKIVSNPDNDVIVIMTGQIDTLSKIFKDNVIISGQFKHLVQVHRITDVDVLEIAKNHAAKQGYPCEPSAEGNLRRRMQEVESGNLDRVLKFVDNAISKAHNREMSSGETEHHLVSIDFE